MNADGLKQWIFRKRRLRQAWRDCFCGRDGKAHAAGQIALADLRRFARINESGLVRDGYNRVDPLAMAYAQGLRAAYERIVLLLNIDDADLYQYDRQERQVKAPND